MTELPANRSIRIEESAVGSAIVSGDGNTIYVIHQTTEQRHEPQLTEGTSKVGPNPYKGLAAFKESDADRYFGREAQVERLLQRFQDLYAQSSLPRFLPILGPSGCGKSSLARAGFIPALARQPLPGKDKMRVAVLVPGSHPLESLAGVLAKVATDDPLPVEKTEEFERVLKKTNDDEKYDGLRRIANLIPGIQDAPLVILVDQFEEIFSLRQDRKAPEEQVLQQVFINSLLHAASDPTGNVSVVITLRSDFLGETQQHKRLNQVIGSDQSVIVPAMTEDELREAIAAPAKQAGHPLDEATIDLLVKDTEGREGALPLLQFALTRIWEGLKDGKEPAMTYREMGGVGGALAGKAQAIYERLSGPERRIAQRVFMGLVQLGEGTRDTRRRATVESLIAKGEQSEAVQQVIRQFSSPGVRLISLSSLDDHETAEVTHEALFEHWQQLNDWLDNSRDDIRFKRRLESIVQYWDDQGRPEGLLWRPPDLDLLREYQPRAAQDMTEVENAFWQASDRAEQRRKRNSRFVTGGLAIGFVLTSLSTGVAFLSVREANRNNIRSLAQSSATLNASGEAFEALIMALRAGKQFQEGRFSDPRILNQIKGEFLSSLSSNNLELHRLGGHSNWVSDVRFSPDGNVIATASKDGTAKLWQTDGTLITTLEGHDDWVYEVRFSPDGSILATASKDGTAKLWQTDGTLITTLEGHDDWVGRVHFSPVRVATQQGLGNILATASKDGTVKLWQTDGTLITTLEGHRGVVWDVRFSPDGTLIATASNDTTAKLWKLDGTLITTFEGHSDVVGDIRFSPDGTLIATASNDTTAKLWKLDGTLITTFEGHSDVVGDMRFSPDGALIATASNDTTAKLWKLDGTLISPLEGHSDKVGGVYFSPDGNAIATASFDSTTKLWQTDGTLIKTFESHSDWVYKVRFSPDGNMIATASFDRTAKLWPIDETRITTLKGHKAQVVRVRFSPVRVATQQELDYVLATASADGIVKLWQTDGTLITTLNGHGDGIKDMHFSPDGSIIVTVTANDRDTVKLWRLDGTLIATLEGHSSWVSDVRFSADGSTLATASADHTAKLWQIDGTLITTLEGHDNGVHGVHFSPDGSTLATASADHTAKLWQIDGTLITTLEGHDNGVHGVHFSPDGSTLATASADRTAKLWQIDGTLITTLEGHDNGVYGVHFSPDGNIIATASSDNTAKLWQIDGTLITTLEGHDNEVYGVYFSPDGSTLATASADRTAKLWQIDGTLITTLEGHDNGVYGVHFSPDGNMIAIAGEESITNLWPWNLDYLLPYTCYRVKGYLKSSPNIKLKDRELCN